MDDRLKRQLQDGGIDAEEALERVMGNEALLKRLLEGFLRDKSFSQLSEALSEGNAEQAFRAAHTLKGVAGTLALKGLYGPVSEATELLRNGDISGAKAGFAELSASYERAVRAIGALK